jgi:holin-like protein
MTLRPNGTVVQFAIALALLVALDALGSWLVRATGAPVPGSVIGMLLLAVLLETGLLPAARVRAAAELLIRHLALLYVPAGVALMAYAGSVRRDLLPICAAAFASLVAVLLVVGVVAQRLGRDE